MSYFLRSHCTLALSREHVLSLDVQAHHPCITMKMFATVMLEYLKPFSAPRLRNPVASKESDIPVQSHSLLCRFKNKKKERIKNTP